MSGMLSRKPDDLPFISGTNRVGSSVERIVINILSAKHVQQLESAAHAATIVFYEFPPQPSSPPAPILDRDTHGRHPRGTTIALSGASVPTTPILC